MSQYSDSIDLLGKIYKDEQAFAGILAPFGLQFLPVDASGDVARPGIYNLPDPHTVTTEAATYSAAGSSVSDAYTGTTLWPEAEPSSR